MSKVFIITPQVALGIKKTKFDMDSSFNPVQDADGNWCLSLEEVKLSKETYVQNKIPNLTTIKTKLNEAIEYKRPVVVFPSSITDIKSKK